MDTALTVVEWAMAAVGAAMMLFLGLGFIYVMATVALPMGLRRLADLLEAHRRAR